MLRLQADELNRFMACNGSRLLVAETPPVNLDDPSARDEGTAAHYMAVQAFRNQLTISEMIDRKAPNGIYMTSDMAEHVEDYLEMLHANPRWDFAAMEVDTSYNDQTWAISGRADFIGFDQANRFLFIPDFKYGWRIVEPENNWTLISHAIGFLEQNKHLIDHISIVRVAIFQPRPHHPDGKSRYIDIPIVDLWNLRNQMLMSFVSPSDELRTGNHCHMCKAIAHCKAARLAEMNAIDMSTIVFYDMITDDNLAFMLDNLDRAKKMLEDRHKAFEELAKHRVKSGKIIPNYGVEMGYGNRRFKDGITADILKIVTGRDLTMPPKLVTPKEAERQGVPEAIIEAFTERSPTGLKLKREKASKKAERIFNK